MSDLEWFPADWVDEICPPARSTPDGFIVPVMGGFELGYADPEQSELHNQPLKVGDVVAFVSCERLPDVEATFKPDGSCELHGTIPAGHNSVIIDGNIDTLHESFDALIEAFKSDDEYLNPREMIFERDETEKRVALEFADWSDPQPFLFEIDNGKPVFRPVPAQKN